MVDIMKGRRKKSEELVVRRGAKLTQRSIENEADKISALYIYIYIYIYKPKLLIFALSKDFLLLLVLGFIYFLVLCYY